MHFSGNEVKSRQKTNAGEEIKAMNQEPLKAAELLLSVMLTAYAKSIRTGLVSEDRRVVLQMQR